MTESEEGSGGSRKKKKKRFSPWDFKKDEEGKMEM